MQGANRATRVAAVVQINRPMNGPCFSRIAATKSSAKRDSQGDPASRIGCAVNLNPSTLMIIHKSKTYSLRIDPENPDHHLYQNNGTWWIHYTVHLPDYTVRRVRHSLKTHDRMEARRLRDKCLQLLNEERSVA